MKIDYKFLQAATTGFDLALQGKSANVMKNTMKANINFIIPILPLQKMIST
jgi:hypothetical protein